MNVPDHLAYELHCTQKALIWALLIVTLVVSIPNIYIANWTATYREFWTSSFGEKPLGLGAELLCRFQVLYRLIAVLIPALTLCVPFLPLRFGTKSRSALGALLIVSLQLLSSLHFLWHEWWITVINGRMYF